MKAAWIALVGALLPGHVLPAPADDDLPTIRKVGDVTSLLGPGGKPFDSVDYSDEQALSAMEARIDDALGAGVQSTPSFFVDGAHAGVSLAELEAAIVAAER